MAVAILAGAAVLRIAGGWNDLWLDEIWALVVARSVRSPLQVFTGLHHEINHYLNTLWLYSMGDRGNWFGYRVPSLVAGIATVLLAGAIGRRRSATTALFTMAVVGGSYVLVLYASEVRGYATCVFFAFLCFDLLDRNLERASWRSAAGYASAAIVGVLSHVHFVSILLAGLVWTLHRSLVDKWTLRESARRIVACHLPPLLAVAVLYWIDIRHMIVGGGTPVGSWINSYLTALAWTLGAPINPRDQLAACLLAIVVFVAGMRLLARGQDARVFFVGVILVFPLSLGILRDSNVVYTRHFLLAIAFLVLLFGFVLASLYERGAWRRVVACLALAAYLIANGQHIARLLRHGRGQPTEVLALLAERSDRPTILVGSDHDFRVGAVLAFHARAAPPAKALDYRAQDAWPPEGPEWVITHAESSTLPLPPTDELRDEAAHRYTWQATFPAAPISGLHWFVYRNVVRR